MTTILALCPGTLHFLKQADPRVPRRSQFIGLDWPHTGVGFTILQKSLKVSRVYMQSRVFDAQPGNLP